MRCDIILTLPSLKTRIIMYTSSQPLNPTAQRFTCLTLCSNNEEETLHHFFAQRFKHRRKFTPQVSDWNETPARVQLKVVSANHTTMPNKWLPRMCTYCHRSTTVSSECFSCSAIASLTTRLSTALFGQFAVPIPRGTGSADCHLRRNDYAEKMYVRLD